MSGTDAERRAQAKAYLRDVATDLRQWVDWAAELGAEYLPVEEVVAPPVVPARPAVTQRPTAPSAPVSSPVPPAETAPAPAGGASLDAVRQALGDCTRCGLHQGRTHLVFGVGDPHADLMLIGEAPGYHEDRLGEPFVGRAGQLLTRMIAAIDVPRDQAYICNLLKCRPPDNRDPSPPEIAACSPFMQAQVQAIAPKVIMTLGRFAGQTLLGLDLSMGRLRDETRSFHGIPVVPTYHPAFLLRKPEMKRQAWEDLLKVRALLRGA